jgi:hypothetical protein
MLLQIVCILLWDIFCVYVRVRINKDNIYIHASRQVMKTHKQTRWFETSSAPSVIPVVLKWRHKQFLLETSGAQSINLISTCKTLRAEQNNKCTFVGMER